jgi:hypothetical protein
MKKIILQRLEHDAKATIGDFSLFEGGSTIYSLEPPPQPGPKIKGETRIPAGVYELELKAIGSSKFDDTALKFMGGAHKGMIRLKDVPNFSEVLIHWGNFEWDTDACVLVGLGRQKDSNGHFAISRSRDGYKYVYPPIVASILSVPTFLDVRDEIT